MKERLDRQINFGFVRIDRAPRELVLQPFVEDSISLVLPVGHQLTKAKFKTEAAESRKIYII